MYKLLSPSMLALSVMLTACGQPQSEAPPPPTPEPEVVTTTVTLDAVLAEQPVEAQARFDQRHPQQTLEFVGVEPGMTVVEVLPGGGWYSKILLPYLGQEGQLIGANYAQDLWPNFGFADEAFIQRMTTWTTDWPAGAQEWRGDNGAPVEAFVFGALPETMQGSADAVLFIRALHNMARFSSERDFLQEAFSNAYDVLRPGGVVGIVQHEARPDMPDEWANGSNGYLKREFVIAQMQQAGFEFLAASDVNANPNDQPTTEDFVWRLPPSYRTAGDDAELRATMDAIGESNRMTLKFIKPKV